MRVVHARPGLPMFGIVTLFALVVMVLTLILTSNIGLGAVQRLFNVVPDRLQIGDAQVRVQDNWVLRSSRESLDQSASLWGMIQLGSDPHSDPFPKGRFYRFEFTGDCDGRTDLILTELSPEQSEPILRLFELPSDQTRSANYAIDTFGKWGSVQTRIAQGTRVLLIIPELRISIGIADPESVACVDPKAFRRAGSQPIPQDPLGVGRS